MNLPGIILHWRLHWTLILLPMLADSAETVRPGFVLLDEGKAKISPSGIRSGEICAGTGVADPVCSTGTRFTVQEFVRWRRS